MRDGHWVVDVRARPPSPEYLSYFHPEHVWFFGKRLGMKRLPKSYTDRSVDEFYAEADRAGIDQMVCVHRIVPAAGGSPASDIPNDHVADLVRDKPGRLFGVAGIDVGGDFGDPIEETRRSVRELGMRGIHISPTRSRLATRADDRRLYPLYELCVELDVPVVVMTGPFAGPDIEDTHPRYIQRVAADFPKLTLVVGHGCWPLNAELLGVAYRHENVMVSPDAYLFMPGGELFVQAANGFLRDQLLYGSAYPVRELDACLDDYMKLGLNEAALEATLGATARRVFKLEAPGAAPRQPG